MPDTPARRLWPTPCWRSQHLRSHALVSPGGDAAVPDPTANPTFPDVAADFWAYKQVEYCVKQGVVKGYPDGTYRPRVAVTRDQMAVYVARAFELQ